MECYDRAKLDTSTSGDGGESRTFEVFDNAMDNVMERQCG